MKRHYHLIWFSALMFLNFTLIIRNLPTEKSDLFSGSGNCTQCHSASGEVFVSSEGRDVSPVYHWQSSMMANAVNDPYWQAKVSSEVEENGHLQTIIEDKCATCHAPMARTQAISDGESYYTFAQVQTESLSLDGVSCTLCHQINADNLASDESFSGHYEIKNTKTIYGPYENPFANSMVNNTGYTPVHGSHIESSALCATCHTLSTPYVDQEGNVAGYFPEQMPYYEWLNSDYPNQKKSCQSCHMPALDETMKIASMPSTLQNKRTPIFEHHFVGGNTIVNQIMQNNREALGINSEIANMDTTASHTLKNLKDEAIDLSAEAKLNGDKIIVDVMLKNKTGHKLPTGFPSRRLWIHFVATNEVGDTIFESGQYNTKGEIITNTSFQEHHDTIYNENDVQIYEAVLGNTNDEVTTILLEASQYLKDNRLPPLGFTNDQVYDSLIAITGLATDDQNFNKENNTQGTGSDVISYAFDTESGKINYSINICYQSIKPSFANHIASSKTSESVRFTQMYSAEESGKLEVIATLNQSISGTTQLTQNTTSEWTVGPNPTYGSVNIYKQSNNKAIDYAIYSLDGKMLENTSTTGIIQFNQLPKGEYLLQLSQLKDSKSFIILYQ